ncbi:MAG: type II toxin-antitoxin system death-on-curing family toxin [Promethearchaeia archaeon]
MVWLPSVAYILEVFQECLDKKPILMNQEGLKATIDKGEWGIPFHPQPTIWDRVAILYRDIVSEHFFADGNKRIGFIIAVICLNKNGYFFETSNDDVYEVTIQTAKGKKTFEDIKKWFKTNSLPI